MPHANIEGISCQFCIQSRLHENLRISGDIGTKSLILVWFHLPTTEMRIEKSVVNRYQLQYLSFPANQNSRGHCQDLGTMIESGFWIFSWFQWEIKRTYQLVWLQNHRLHNIMQIYIIAVWNQIQFLFLIFYRYYKSIFESHTICRRFPRYLSLWHSTLDLKDSVLSSGVAFNRCIGIYRRLSLNLLLHAKFFNNCRLIW